MLDLLDLSTVSISKISSNERMLSIWKDQCNLQICQLASTLRSDLGDKEVERIDMERQLSLIKNLKKKLIITLKLWYDGYGEVEEDDYAIMISNYNDEHDTDLSWEEYFDNYYLYV